MRGAFLATVLLVGGCGVDQIGNYGPTPAPGIAAAINIGSVVAIGRTPVDLVVSLISGRDCSSVRLERGLEYCAPDYVPEPVPFCTRSLGAVDCWSFPPASFPPYRGVAQGQEMTPAQRARLGRRWPGLLPTTVVPLGGVAPPVPAPAAVAVAPVVLLAPPVPAEAVAQPQP